MTKRKATATPLKNISFEDALEELEAIVTAFEEGQDTLEKALKNYERGILLKDHCLQQLKEAEARIEKITRRDEKTVTKKTLRWDEMSS